MNPPTILGIVVMVGLGLLYSNFLEWLVHRYVLHNRRFGWFYRFHFSEHHRNSRKNAGVDPDYLVPMKSGRLWSTRTKEIVSLILLGVAHLPLWLVLPWVMVGATVGMGFYYGVHARAHRDISWARTWVPWHLDHHLGRNQNMNWNVTVPIFDHLFGTRVSSPTEGDT